MKSKRRNNRYTKASKAKIVKQVCLNYSTGLYTMSSVCEDAGVPERTYRSWFKMYENFGDNIPEEWMYFAELAEMWKEACDNYSNQYRKGLVEKAARGLEKRVSGYEYEEVRETQKRVPNAPSGETSWETVSRVITTKYCPPSIGAIQFVLTTLDRDTFNPYPPKTVEIEKIDPLTARLNKMTSEELDAEIARLEAELKK